MKQLFIHLAALLCAAAVFGGCIVYAANQMETSEGKTEYTQYYDKDGLFITDLLELHSEGISSKSAESRRASSTSVSSPSSDVSSSSSALSSKESSSAASSSKAPVSSKPSSKPASSSSVSSQKPSSKPSSDPLPPVPVDDWLLDKLAGAVQREIVGINTPPSAKYYEAYKAQAVATHSYLEYHGYPATSYTTPHPQTLELVRQVLDEMMYYDGEVINAAYHAASGGHTQSSTYIWGGALPYLTGVPSKYDDYISSTTVPALEMQSKLKSAGITVSGDPAGWFDLKNASRTDGGYVDYIPVGGKSLKGRTLRESLLGTQVLKSPKITDIKVSGNNIVFSTKGFGHGAGMSQQGALGYAANEGWSYKQILTHYYKGVTIH